MRNEDMPTQETAFNSSLASLKRLSDSFERCHYFYQMATMEGTQPSYLYMLKKELITAFKEIYPKLNNKEKEKIISKIKKLNKCTPLTEIVGEPHRQQIYPILKNCHRYESILLEIELLLRRLADNKGMLMTNKKSIGEEL